MAKKDMELQPLTTPAGDHPKDTVDVRKIKIVGDTEVYTVL